MQVAQNLPWQRNVQCEHLQTVLRRSWSSGLKVFKLCSICVSTTNAKPLSNSPDGLLNGHWASKPALQDPLQISVLIPNRTNWTTYELPRWGKGGFKVQQKHALGRVTKQRNTNPPISTVAIRLRGDFNAPTLENLQLPCLVSLGTLQNVALG